MDNAQLDGNSPSADDGREALERILSSPEFKASGRRKEFLRYLVEAGLAGDNKRLKSFAIAVDVFGRDDSFDSQTDPVVRLEARRIRRDLEHYYLTAGRKDPVRISIPKGSYAPTFEWQDDALPPAIGETSIIATERQRGHDPRSIVKRSTRWSWLAVTVLVIAVVGALAWHEFEQEARLSASDPARPPTRGEDPATPLSKGLRVAVLPFQNLSGDPGQDYFSDGIAEQISTDLTRYSDLSVFSVHSTIKNKGKSPDPDALRRELGVGHVIEGSFRREEATIVVSVRLIETSSSRITWSKTYQEKLEPRSVFAVQQEISQNVAAAIGSRYGPVGQKAIAASRISTPTNISVYDCVLRYYYYLRVFNSGGHSQVRDCLEKAVQSNPKYSMAWAALSNVYAHEYRYGFNPRPEAYDPNHRALETAERALELAPGNAIAHLMLANAYFDRHNLDVFKRAGEKAVALNSNNPDILADYGARLAFMGEWERGLKLMNKAMALNPFHPGWYYFPIAFIHYHRGEYERALTEGRKIDMPQFPAYVMLMTACLGQIGRIGEAQAEAQLLQRLDPEYPAQLWQRLGAWNFPRPLTQQVADGLRKAGLDIPPLPPAP